MTVYYGLKTTMVKYGHQREITWLTWLTWMVHHFEKSCMVIRKFLMTSFPRRMFNRRIFSLERWQLSELWPMGRRSAGALRSFSRVDATGIVPPSRTKSGVSFHTFRIASSASCTSRHVGSASHQSPIECTVTLIEFPDLNFANSCFRWSMSLFTITSGSWFGTNRTDILPTAARGMTENRVGPNL